MALTPQPVNTQKDFQLIPLLNLVAEPITGSATPSAGSIGRLYRNTTSKRLEYVWDATTIVSIPYSGAITDSDIAAGAAIALSKLATNPLARANHTGTQLAATISDFDAQVNTHHVNDLAVATADLNMNTHKITGVVDGVNPQDVTTLQQVTNLLAASINGQDWKNSVRVASTTNVNVASPGANVDGVAMSAGDRVLLAGQTTGSQNGIYVWNGSATPMTRALDADASIEVTSGMTVPVETGTKQDTLGILTTDGAITLGTTSIAFTFIPVAAAYTASGSIQVVGNVISIVAGGVSVAEGGTGSNTAAGARANLGTNKAGFEADIPSITAGSSVDITHSLALSTKTACIIQVKRKSDGLVVPDISAAGKDANTVTIQSDVAVSTAQYVVAVLPLFA